MVNYSNYEFETDKRDGKRKRHKGRKHEKGKYYQSHTKIRREL